MIDVHTHILPFFDDGSDDLQESFRMIEREITLGIKDIIITSHALRLDLRRYTQSELKDAFAVFQKQVKDKYDVSLYLGQEIAYCEKMISLLKRHELLTINGSEFLLLELPFDQAVPDMEELVFSCRVLGFKVVIAHAERYNYYEFKDLLDLKKRGVFFQINSNSLTGRGGKDVQKLVFKLLKNGLVDLVGSDVHAFRKNDLDEAFQIVDRKFGHGIANDIFQNNAARMFRITNNQ
ncbi:MAG: CpsB/CapC family capsule biosynthesis tyrosine phosphatase [Bacteroidales bacterium]